MTPERWARVRELICEALDRQPSQRAAYLEDACANDSELRSQVESLMAASESSGSLPSSIIPTRRLAAGTVIDHFKILSLLGAGGMGEVYRARDQQLKRDVAIKLLPAGLCLNRERQRRFEQEARAAAALNHPNILAIYQLGWHEAQPYIVAELLEGQTLREALKHGALPVAKVIDYGLQLAQGLAVAHDKGIIHRDLKPENIFIAKTGQLKILDFGLAKLRSGADEETRTRRDTDAGVIVGTLAYMSPEQVRGQTVDQRSDMFSLGAILYEILTNRRPFDGRSGADLTAAILHEEPKPLRELAPSVPWELERVIARCLRKDPERRLRSMADLAVALQELKEESDSGHLATAPSPRRKSRSKIAIISIAIGAVIAIGAAGVWLRTYQPQQTVFNVVPITTYPGTEKDPSFSPDGTQVAFSWNGLAQQRFHIYVKAIGPGPPLQLTNTAANDSAPMWSPDAGSIAFLRDLGAGHYKVILIPALGGPERSLTDILISAMWLSGPYLSWTPDSRSLLFPHQPRSDAPAALFLLDVEGGEKRQITFPPAGILGDGCAAVSPDGQTLAFCRCAQIGDWLTDLYTVPLGSAMPGHEIKQLASDRFRVTGLTWNNQGTRLVFSSDREDGTLSLWTLPVPNRPGNPATGLQVGSATWPTIARRSSRLAFVRTAPGTTSIWRSELRAHGMAAEKPTSLIASTRSDFAPKYSPDGQKIAFESSRGGSLQIWTCDGQGENCLQVTSMNAEYTGTPSWSPDGSKIAFYSRAGGKSQIFVIGADGMGLRQLTPGDSNYFFPRWSRDGEWIYVSSNRSGTAQIWKFPSRGGSPVQVTREGGFAALESHDGKSLYYTKMQATDSSLWKLSFDTHEEAQVLRSILIHNFDVVDDGIYFEDGTSKLKFLDTHQGTTINLIQLPEGYVGLSVSPDRKSIVFTHSVQGSSELMLIDNFQ